MSRLNELLELAATMGVPKRHLANMIGVSRQQLWFWTSGRNNPSSDREPSFRELRDTLLAIGKDPRHALELHKNPTVENLHRLRKRIRRARASANVG